VGAVVREPDRKITIQDAMIVVAATAISIAWTRGAAEDILQRSTQGVPPGVRFPLETIREPL
jgi:hypothetical protein